MLPMRAETLHIYWAIDTSFDVLELVELVYNTLSELIDALY